MAIIRKYKTGKGEQRYRVMWRDGIKQKSKSFDRWKIANDYKVNLEHTLRSGTYVQPINVTVSEYFKEWFPLHSENLAFNTVKSYGFIIKLYIEPNIGDIPLQKLNSAHIEVMCKKVLKGKSNRTARYAYTIINTALKAAIKMKYITYNPCDAVDKPKSKPTKAPIALQPDELNPYISAFEGTWMYIVVILGFFTGLRRGELVALRWHDINFKDNKISVNGSIYWDGKKRVRKAPKSGKTRTVYMPETLAQILRQHRKKQKRLQLLLGVQYKKSDYVVTEDDGTCPRPDYITRYFGRKLKSKRLPHIRVQDLRHTSGSIKIYEGADLQTVSDDLGHHSAAFTAKTYIHTINEAKKKSANSMDKYLKEIK